MSKPYYETEEYNEAENELDTYDDPVKLVMEYRISEKHKDNKIADLEAKLAEKERQLKLAEELLIKQEKEYDEQLEKQAKIHYRHLKEKDQDKILFAIAKLEKVKDLLLEKCGETYSKTYCGIDEDIEEIIGNQINELKGGK